MNEFFTTSPPAMLVTDELKCPVCKGTINQSNHMIGCLKPMVTKRHNFMVMQVNEFLTKFGYTCEMEKQLTKQDRLDIVVTDLLMKTTALDVRIAQTSQKFGSYTDAMNANYKDKLMRYHELTQKHVIDQFQPLIFGIFGHLEERTMKFFEEKTVRMENGHQGTAQRNPRDPRVLNPPQQGQTMKLWKQKVANAIVCGTARCALAYLTLNSNGTTSGLAEQDECIMDGFSNERVSHQKSL